MYLSCDVIREQRYSLHHAYIFFNLNYSIIAPCNKTRIKVRMGDLYIQFYGVCKHYLKTRKVEIFLAHAKKFNVRFY